MGLPKDLTTERTESTESTEKKIENLPWHRPPHRPRSRASGRAGVCVLRSQW